MKKQEKIEKKKIDPFIVTWLATFGTIVLLMAMSAGYQLCEWGQMRDAKQECVVFWDNPSKVDTDKNGNVVTIYLAEKSRREFDNEKDARFFMRHLKAVEGAYAIRGFVTKKFVCEKTSAIE